MDPGVTLKHENPKSNSNFLSKLFYIWALRFFKKHKKNGLDIDDLYVVDEEDKSENLGDLLELSWNKELITAKKNGKKPSLLKALLKVFAGECTKGVIMMFLQFFFRGIQPLILHQFIYLFRMNTSEDVFAEMYIVGAMLILVTFFVILLFSHLNYCALTTGVRFKIALSSLIYRKATRLNQVSLGKISTGKITNLLSNDLSRFDVAFRFLPSLFIAPIMIVCMPYFLWRQVGIASFVGIVYLIVFNMSLITLLGKLVGKLRPKVAKQSDDRIKMVSEIMSGIKAIKMYAWEEPFEKMTQKAREAEISIITKASYLQAVRNIMQYTHQIPTVLIIATFVLLGNQITSEMSFSIFQCMFIVHLLCAIFYPFAVFFASEVLSSIKRITDFLVLDEKTNTILILTENRVHVDTASASWNDVEPVLEQISIQVPPGALCVIVGQVGSGKSSLLQLLLGELQPVYGKVFRGGTISYSSQEPWLYSSSIRNNITFDQPYDDSLYQEIIKVCALERDFQQFPHGDHTLVGDKGASLSGGQKARINLARAVYRQASIYIMDDPLSAVDTHVGKYLFKHCICGYLKQKTRILVTHQVQYLKEADLIIVMDKGHIDAIGTYAELKRSRMDFNKFLESSKEIEDKKIEPNLKTEAIIAPSLAKKSSSNVISQIKLVENREMGSTQSSFRTLREYFKAMESIFFLILLIVFFIIGFMFNTSTDFWLAFWTSQEDLRSSLINDTHEVYSGCLLAEHYPGFLGFLFEHVPANGTDCILLKTSVCLYIYAFFNAGNIMIMFGQSYLFYKLAMAASKNLHKKMFHSLLLTSVRFFEVNPAGRILNRFTKDIGAVDEILPAVLMDVIKVPVLVLSALVNTGISNPYGVGASLVCGIFIWMILMLQLTTAKNIKHIEAVTKSSVFSHVSSTMNGLPTIRATGSEGVLISQFDHHQNINSSAAFLTATCTPTFGFWIDFMCLIFVTCITFSSILLKHFYDISGSFVGLELTMSLTLIGSIQYGVYQAAELVNQLTSVERILQYSSVETEGQFETPKENMLEDGWPKEGNIAFKSVSVKYVENEPPVLRDISFDIHEGEKIGIVGRTGAGKSSLIVSLFRLAQQEGSILIDGVDTKTLGLTKLRSSISIIPQDPVLFSASLRYNLDPHERYNDYQMWAALDHVNLRNVAPTLNYLVREGGSNFSVGERQLICLARAILRRNRILVLDEATANVDLSTDTFIQATIRKTFKDCTVLTIAHRLNTIMDSDRVIVMNSGMVAEFDTPFGLLQNEEGYFRKMIQETGPDVSEQLKNMAIKKDKTLRQRH